MSNRISYLCRPWRRGALVLALTIAAAPGAIAQVMGMPGLDASKPLGRTAAPAAAESNGDLRPPSFTDAQVERGRRAYMDSCGDCHGDRLNNGEFGGAPLTGSYFNEHWGGLTVDSLYGYLSSAMPPNRPGSLNAQTYTDITTFLLAKNGFQPNGGEMPPDEDVMATMAIDK